MAKSDYYDGVVGVIADILGVGKDRISGDTAIGDLEAWDSLRHIQIISAIERKFGIRFTPDVMMDMEDVDDIVSATEERAGK